MEPTGRTKQNGRADQRTAFKCGCRVAKRITFTGVWFRVCFPNRRASKRFGHIIPDTSNHALAKLFGLKVRPGKPPENKLGDAGIEHFTIHNLRRTCRTLLTDAGVSGHVADRCLNHKLKGVEGIYDRYDYLDERREALQKITDQLAPIINPMANVTSFRKGA